MEVDRRMYKGRVGSEESVDDVRLLERMKRRSGNEKGPQGGPYLYGHTLHGQAGVERAVERSSR